MPVVTSTVETGQPQLQPSKLPNILPNVLAGLAIGMVNLTYGMSFAALIFSGTLSPYFPMGIGNALVSSVVVGIIVALRSSFPFAIAGPGANATPILALITTAIAEEIQRSGHTAQLLPTVWIAITLTTLLSGLLLYGMGRLHLGRWARFIPYPVMGGFLVGTGWLVVRSSFKVITGLPLGWEELAASDAGFYPNSLVARSTLYCFAHEPAAIFSPSDDFACHAVKHDRGLQSAVADTQRSHAAYPQRMVP